MDYLKPFTFLLSYVPQAASLVVERCRHKEGNPPPAMVDSTSNVTIGLGDALMGEPGSSGDLNDSC